MAGTTGLWCAKSYLALPRLGLCTSMSRGALGLLPNSSVCICCGAIAPLPSHGMPQNRDDNDATLFWHVRAALEICSAALLVDNGDLIELPVGFPQRSR